MRGVELVEDLVERSRASLADHDLPWATVELAAPACSACPTHAPYDRILVSAETDKLPDALVDQLGEHGRMVVPVAGGSRSSSATVTHRPRCERVGYYRFVPLR